MEKNKELIRIKALLLFLVMGLLIVNYFVPIQSERYPLLNTGEDNLTKKEGISLKVGENIHLEDIEEENDREKTRLSKDTHNTYDSHNLDENIRRAASNNGNLSSKVRRLKSDGEIKSAKIQEIVDETPMQKEWAMKLVEKSNKYEIDIYLLLGLIRVESVFDPNNVSHAGALGLMQLMPSTGRHMAQKLGLEYSKDMLLDPEYNIKLGTFYVNNLLEKYDEDVHKALTAYNRGEGGLKTFINRSGSAKSGFSRIVLEKADKYESKIDVSESH